MKLHKLISRTVLATALLGVTFVGAFSGTNVNAENTNGNSTTPNMGKKVQRSQSQSYEGGKYSNSYVKDGFLTLDSVPTLNFGNDNNNDSNILTLNSGNNGVLRITDYRNIDKNGNNASNDQYRGQAGWQLSVSMGQFNNQDGYNSSSLNNNDWSMHLSKQASYNNIDLSNHNNDASKVNFNDQDLSTNGTNNDESPMLNTIDNSTKGYGVNEITYNNNNDATLDIPNVPQGNYSANMNWTLSTQLSSYNTNTNS